MQLTDRPRCVFRRAWLVGLIWLTLSPTQCAAVTEEEKAQAAALSERILAAGRLYAAGSLIDSASQVTAIQRELIQLLETDDAALQRLVKPTYLRLERAHSLLALAGAKLDPLPSWEELIRPAPTPDASAPNKLNAASSISFARTVAPILMSNCQGCHIGSRQASGGLRMDTFAQFMRGGDSGAIVVPAQAMASLIVKRIRGEEGDRMPAGGRPALTPEQIDSIAAWIDSGAPFDGSSADLDLATVNNQVWAASAEHSELFARRQQNALDRWTRVLPNDQPATAKNEELFVLGNLPPEHVEKILVRFSDATTNAKKLLKTPAAEPLLSGGLTVFVLKSRYDYSEFGRMTEKRELPKQWLGHWHADPLDAYGVITADLETSDKRNGEKQAEALALQVTIGSYLGSLPRVPNWFAEGVARQLVSAEFRRDPRVAAWHQALPTAMLKVENAKMLLDERLDEEVAGLVGMSLAGFMMERNNRRRFEQLLVGLRNGQPFDVACTANFTAPDALVKSWLGK